MTHSRTLSPDPEGQNDARAQLAETAIGQFQICTGSDWDDALADLLADLMHLCDRATHEDGTALNFAEELERARQHYEAETMADERMRLAARDMLEALEIVAAENTEIERLEEIAKAAIAKAKGGAA
jgi:hypothetical protein